MLVVDGDTLRLVDTLNTLDEVLLHIANVEYSEDVFRVRCSFEQLLSHLDRVTGLNEELGVLGNGVRVGFVTVVRRQHELAQCARLVNRHSTVGVRDRAGRTRGTRFEELRHSRETLSDVDCRCRTTGVEGTHGQLGSGFTNRLRRDDADCLTEVNGFTRRHRESVARTANTLLRFTRER